MDSKQPDAVAVGSDGLLGAECRGCGLPLRGRPYCYGGSAHHPRTGERAKINHYGGYVCSRTCDYRASLELEQTMPGHGYQQTRLSCYASESLARNWS
jgi:hypothetical protein